jgi:uncharacterized MAPEG superfamily protein
MPNNAPLICLVGYAAWAMLLVLSILSWRGLEILRGNKKFNEFPGGLQHGSSAYWRLNRAHANTVENLPIVAALVLAGLHLHATAGLFGQAALVALVARVVQSLVHASSGSVPATALRFTAFATQYVCFGVMLVQILRSL